MHIENPTHCLPPHLVNKCESAFSFGFIIYGIKGGESSSQFRWFTIAKIQLQLWMFVVLILRLLLQRYSTNAKRYPQKKSFWKLWVLFFPPKPHFSKLLGLLWFWREQQNSEFPKTFSGGYLLAFVEYLCNRSPKIKTTNIKNYSSISAIVNQRNWLDDSPPLSCNFMHLKVLEINA